MGEGDQVRGHQGGLNHADGARYSVTPVLRIPLDVPPTLLARDLPGVRRAEASLFIEMRATEHSKTCYTSSVILGLGVSPMRRREFIALLGSGVAAWPLAARAQRSGKVRRIGFISGGSPAASSDILAGFPQGMRELGYAEGKDFIIEWRYAEGKYERFVEFATELVGLGVDVIVLGTQTAVGPVQQVSRTVPIVMGYSTDPVGSGLVANLARPGGQVTGLAGSSDDTSPKQIELLSSVVPNLSRIGVLQNPLNPTSPPNLRATQAAARQAGMTPVVADAAKPDQIEAAFNTFARERVQAIKVTSDAFFMITRKQITALALKNHLPSIYAQKEYAEAGGLMSYGESLREFYRRAATYVDKILKGATPGDLPIEQPTRFNLVINRKTADLLKLAIPPQLYIFADEVIE